MLPKSSKLWLRPAVYLTLVYLTLSLLWILLSDSVAQKLAGGNLNTLHMMQRTKGVFFVLISGITLFCISRRFYRHLANSFLQKERSEQKYRALNEAAREGIFDCDLSNMNAQVNNRMRFFLPGDTDMIENFRNAWIERVHPEDLARLKSEYNDTVTSGKSTAQFECRLLGADNKYYSIISSICLLREPVTRKPQRIIGTLLDISELRNLQAEQYEQRLKHKQELTTSIIRAQEKERNRWAEELHDNVCQLLTVAKLYLDQMEKREESVSELLPEARMLVKDAMTEIRQLSASIKPPSFSETTLKESLRKLTSDIRRVKDIRFNFEFDRINERILCEEQKLLAYRVVQEQLNNIVKYADATNVDISLVEEDEKLVIKVKDDGIGFDPQRVKSGIGLRNIQSRLQHYKGNMNIESAIGQGCTLSAEFNVKIAVD